MNSLLHVMCYEDTPEPSFQCKIGGVTNFDGVSGVIGGACKLVYSFPRLAEPSIKFMSG